MMVAVGEVQINTLPMVAKGLSVHSFPSGHAQDSGRSYPRKSNVATK